MPHQIEAQLHCISQRTVGHEAIVTRLLERGADPTLRETTFNGDPAGWAQAGGHQELAAHLRSMGEH